MRNYSYDAIDYSGKNVKGRLASETITSATRDLNEKGLYIVSIREATSQQSYLYQLFKKIQVGRQDILEFTQSFSVMMNAGIPIIAVLDDILISTTKKAFKPFISDIKQRLERGSSLSAALEAQGKLFPDIVKTLVLVGEETGHLEENLRKASEHLQRMLDLSAAIRKALLNPVIAFAAIFGALTFWMLFVIPNLVVTLKGLGVKLPALTLAIIATSNFFQSHWKMLFFTLSLTPLVIILLGKNRQFRYIRDLTLIKLPFIKVIIFNKLLATFSEQFRILMAAGIAIERLFDLLIPALGNEYFAVNLLKAKENILYGRPISESLEQQKILPPLVISKIRVGETSGSLDKQFDFLAKYFTTKLDNATDTLGKIVEPLAMVVIGGLFAIMIMGLLLPIYDLVSTVGKA
jgi:type II secretory pathway component PulF